jgi:hypothetical protein
MFSNLGLHVIKYPTGKYGYVGTIPRALGKEVPASADDVMAGRWYTNAEGKTVTTKFPIFSTSAEAVTFAKGKGFKVTSADPNPIESADAAFAGPSP